MLSDLEQAVLGVVWLEAPCTAYAVRMTFQKSPSSHWSGSAGAIYPLVRRLERDGLLASARRAGDGRATRLYRLSKTGLAALRAWLRPPLPPAGALIAADPLRVRVRFLAALPPGARLAFLDEAETKLREMLILAESEARRGRGADDLYRALTHRGAALALRAQLEFIDEVRATVSGRATERRSVNRGGARRRGR